MESRRTTIVLEKELYRGAKRLALEQDKTLKEIVDEALRAYLTGDQRGQRSRRACFGVYHGKVCGNLKRESIYRHLLK